MGLQTLDHAMAVLKALGASRREGLRLIDIERRLGLSHATAHRLLSALEQHEMIEIVPATLRYRLGPELTVLGLSAWGGMRDVSRVLADNARSLAQQAGETVFVSTCSGYEGVCVERYPGKYHVDAMQVGDRSPLGLGAGSQAILAALPERQAQKMIDAVERCYDGRVEGQSIRSAVAHARSAGWSVSKGLVSDSVRSIGVAVRDTAGDPLAALVIVSPAERLSERRVKTLVGMLMRTRRSVEVRERAGA